jgi:hypothetical protein
MATLRYFDYTKEETVGDFGDRESEAVGIIDTILEKIEDMIDAKYGIDANIIIENTNEIQNMVWEHVCDYNENLDETDDDYQETAEHVYDWVQVYEVGNNNASTSF